MADIFNSWMNQRVYQGWLFAYNSKRPNNWVETLWPGPNVAILGSNETDPCFSTFVGSSTFENDYLETDELEAKSVNVCCCFYLPHYAVDVFIIEDRLDLDSSVSHPNTECVPLGGLEKAPSVKHCCVSCRCLTQMEKDGLSVDDIFGQCVFRQDERDMVLRAVHIVHPEYQPSLSTSTDQCFPSLVQDYYFQVCTVPMGCSLNVSHI